ncbi:MAG: RteC domain-containing protein [Cellulophaga sp.]
MEYQNLISEFEINLENVESCNNDILCKAEAGMTQAKRYLKRLRKQVILKGFPSSKEEIHFFKHIKPRIFSKLIYYVKLYTIETKRPRSSSKFQIKYLNNHINELQIYFNDNLELYHYYRQGATILDEQYFVRGKSVLRFPTESFDIFLDEQFSTCHDRRVATILAYDTLIMYLKKEIQQLEVTNTRETTVISQLNWNGHKNELVELGYALCESGRINNGNVDKKEVVLALQRLFNVDNDNIYTSFTNIRGRKLNLTKFIDTLKEALLRYMKQLDE